MSSKEHIASLVSAGRRTGSTSYAPAPVILERGAGMWLHDTAGRTYLDFLAGIAVSALGHAHPVLTERLHTQVARLLHVSNAFFTEPQIEFQQALTRASSFERVFLANSGTEANEAAIKLARRWQRVVAGTPRFEVVTFRNSFHGRTYGALSATAQPKYHAGFEPMVPGFVTAEFGDLESVSRVVGEHTAAILVEPVQGEGGVRPASRSFLEGLRGLADEHGALLIFDEVQCGMGRTGSLFAFQHYGVRPDIMSLAKGIGGGVPLGAMLADDAIFEGFTRGSHATTYGGNPLACTAGLAVLEVLGTKGFLEQVQSVGAYVRERGQELVDAVEVAVEVRGLGQMNGIELDASRIDAGAVVAAARERGLLLNTAGGSTLRLVPPLIASHEDVDEAMGRLRAAIDDVVDAGSRA